jgi:hypothetical protein
MATTTVAIALLAPSVITLSSDVTDKLVITGRHPIPGQYGTTDNTLPFMMNVNYLATLITVKIGKIVTIQAEVMTLQSAIKRINRMTLSSVVKGRTATTGKSRSDRMFRFNRHDRISSCCVLRVAP